MFVVSPTDRWLNAELRNCSASFTVASPYVGMYLGDVVKKLKRDISVTLLTRTLITDFASQASDLEAVYKLAKRSGGIFSLSSLHAKVYIVDKRTALVTSANATYAGMHRNRECGLEVTLRSEVRSLCDLVDTGFGAIPRPAFWTPADLDELRGPVNALRSSLPKVTQRKNRPADIPQIQLQRRELDRLIESFSGWLRLTMEGIARIKSNIFTMDEVWKVCAPLANKCFPDNKHIREKSRQQMQRLRDLGLVLFLGNGRYERLASVR